MTNESKDDANPADGVEPTVSSGTSVAAELPTTARYEAPSLRYVGSVRELTLGSIDGVVDEQSAGGPED